MAKEVKVSIIVDDNGTMRLTEKSAKKLGASLDNAGKLPRAQKADRQLKGAAQAAAELGVRISVKASSRTIQGGLVPAYATLAAHSISRLSAAFLDS